MVLRFDFLKWNQCRALNGHLRSKLAFHVRSFYSALPEEPTRDVLRVLKRDPRLLDLLRKRPTGQIGILWQIDWTGLEGRIRSAHIRHCRKCSSAATYLWKGVL